MYPSGWRGHDPEVNGPPSGYRIYDRRRLGQLVEGLKIESLRFFGMQDGCWIEEDQNQADEIPTSRPVNAIFFAQLRVGKNKA